MTHQNGTPKTHYERIPKPSGDRTYYDGFARHATIDFITDNNDELVLVRRDGHGVAMDKFYAGRDFQHVRVLSLPDNGAIVLIEAVPTNMDYRILGAITAAMEYDVMEQQTNAPHENIHTYTPVKDHGHGYSHI